MKTKQLAYTFVERAAQKDLPSAMLAMGWGVERRTGNEGRYLGIASERYEKASSFSTYSSDTCCILPLAVMLPNIVISNAVNHIATYGTCPIHGTYIKREGC
jgi:hypothetical protein